MITGRAIRLLLVVLVPSLLFAQGTRTDSPVTGDIRTMSVQSRGAPETNVIFATLAAGAALDNNNNNSFDHPIAGEQYFAEPSVVIQETRKHLAWDLSYSPTLRIFVPSSSRPDVFNQTAGGILHYDVTKRLDISLRQDYLRTFDPFQQLGDTPLLPGVGLGNRPGAVFLPDFRRTELLSQAGIDYRLTKHTSLGLAGAFEQIQGSQVGGPHTSLIATHDSLGSAFLSHQISPRQSVGVQYQFLDILFPGQDVRTRSHGVLLFDQMAISPHLNFSVFAGPEYSQIHNQVLLNVLGVVVKLPVSSTLWSPSAGGTFEWRGERSALQAIFVRRVSDGGGLQGAVEMNDALLRLRTKLWRRWVANFDGETTRRTLLNEPGVGTPQVLDLGAGLSYALRDHLWVRALYQRKQIVGDAARAFLAGNHNRLTLTIERNFTLPLGR